MKDEPLPRRTQDEVFRLVADALGLRPHQLSGSSVAQDFSEWDSMGTLAILAAVSRDGVKLEIGEAASLQSMEGILGLYRSTGRLE